MSDKLYVVTVRVKKSPEHDPKNKKTGACPVSGLPCTDIMGEHHTALVSFDHESTAEGVREIYEGIYHVTRVEQVSRP